jgi:hypothetical protein
MSMGVVDDKEFEVEKEKLTPKTTSPSDINNGRVQDSPESYGTPTDISINPYGIPSIEIGHTIIKDMIKGRGLGNVEVPNGLRKLIGEESAINGRQSAIDLARSLDISPSSVSAYDNGATSTASYNQQPNLTHINNARSRVSTRARNKLMMALRHISEDKLENAKVGEISAVARNMASIVKDMEPESPNKDGKNTLNQPTFVFYSPQIKREDTFDIIKINE